MFSDLTWKRFLLQEMVGRLAPPCLPLFLYGPDMSIFQIDIPDYFLILAFENNFTWQIVWFQFKLVIRNGKNETMGFQKIVSGLCFYIMFLCVSNQCYIFGCFNMLAVAYKVSQRKWNLKVTSAAKR